MVYEPKRLRISDNEAFARVWLSRFMISVGFMGCGGTLGLTLFLLHEGAPKSLLLIDICCALALLALAVYWIEFKPKYSRINLKALEPGEVVQLVGRLNYDASKEQLRVWLKDDHPIRVWDRRELLNMDLRLDEDKDRRKLEEFMNSPTT